MNRLTPMAAVLAALVGCTGHPPAEAPPANPPPPPPQVPASADTNPQQAAPPNAGEQPSTADREARVLELLQGKVKEDSIPVEAGP